jgi:hypothetical protein
MSEPDLDLLDDFVFEPTPWDLAFSIGIGVDPETDRVALDELADAMLMWAPEPMLEQLTGPALDALWDDELPRWIREGLVRLSGEDGWEKGAAAALAEFDRAPRAAAVSREVIRGLASQLGSADHPVFFCLDCLNESLSDVEPPARRALARRAAIVARRDAAVPDDEVQAAMAEVTARSPTVRLGTVERRAAVRTRLGRLGELGRDSMPALAAELRALAAEPLPAHAEDDDVWEEVCTLLLAGMVCPQSSARPDLN